jgi:hypothetical protein
MSEKEWKSMSDEEKQQLILACQHGFWLNENVFIKSESAEVVLVERKDFRLEPPNQIIKKPMLILSNAVELTVDRNGKILDVKRHSKFGLWCDVVEKVSKA